MVRYFSVLTIMITLFITSAAFADGAFRLKKADGTQISIENPYGDLWEYSENGQSWSLSCSDNGKVVFRKGYGTLAEGIFKGSKLEVNSIYNELFIRMKLKSDKVKVNWNKSDDIWELKKKEYKIKASRNGIEYGKVKFYADTGKLKVKDRFDKTVVGMKSFSRLSFAPGVFLMTDLSKDQQVFLTILLFAKKL